MRDGPGKLTRPEVVPHSLIPHPLIPTHCIGPDGSIQNTSQWCPSGS
jgi:hypothetical protein